MSVDFSLYSRLPVPEDVWLARATANGLRIEGNVPYGVFTIHGTQDQTSCWVYGPDLIDPDEFEFLPEPSRVTRRGAKYEISCHLGGVGCFALEAMLYQIVDEVNGLLLDPQTGEWYPAGLTDALDARVSEERASAEAWVSRLPLRWAIARRISMYVVWVFGLVTLAWAVGTIVIEKRDGRLSSHHQYVWMVFLAMLGASLLAYFVHALTSRVHDSHIRQAAWEWVASLSRAPLYLPEVFAKHFPQNMPQPTYREARRRKGLSR